MSHNLRVLEIRKHRWILGLSKLVGNQRRGQDTKIRNLGNNVGLEPANVLYATAKGLIMRFNTHGKPHQPYIPMTGLESCFDLLMLSERLHSAYCNY